MTAARVTGKSWGYTGIRSLRDHIHHKEELAVVKQDGVTRLISLGVRPDGLAGRLRLVLTIGCYGDFRFTRDILSSSVKHEQIEPAIEVLSDLGARCDCEVFQAIGQLPRVILWHHATEHEAEQPTPTGGKL